MLEHMSNDAILAVPPTSIDISAIRDELHFPV